jgi:hypothetical protein
MPQREPSVNYLGNPLISAGLEPTAPRLAIPGSAQKVFRGKGYNCRGLIST